MTTWSIEYGDEAGNQNTRTTDDIGEVHATLEVIVNDEERTAGYAGQTATWHGFEERDPATGHGRGNWTLHVTNLDTHTVDGYTLEEEAFYSGLNAPEPTDNLSPMDGSELDDMHTMTEPTMTTLAPIAERGQILTNMMLGLASLHTSKSWLTVEWDGGSAPVNIIEWSDGWTAGVTRTWTLELSEDSPNIAVWVDGTLYDNLPPMDALVYIHHAIQR